MQAEETKREDEQRRGEGDVEEGAARRTSGE
jgi:hypothetical protein